MVYLCLPMANQGAYIIKKTTRFEVIPVFACIFRKRNRHPLLDQRGECSFQLGKKHRCGAIYRPR